MYVSGPVTAVELSLSPEEMAEIGEKIFINECAGKDRNLLQWNEGEDFLSCGIGHFIWYPAKRTGPFAESFPKFLNFAGESGIKLPSWLDANHSSSCPWPSREIFLNSRDDYRIEELREFLRRTKNLQSEFIFRQLKESLPAILENSSEEERRLIGKRFERMLSTSAGTYALADYVNFKGLGILPAESYEGKGWGLKQVLLAMGEPEGANGDLLAEFAAAAIEVLAERARNAPPRRFEERWLPGWKNRINSYLE